MPPTIHDTAAAILEGTNAPISTAKLQSLTYLAQGWSLELRGSALFPDAFQAWSVGPVSAELFHQHRHETTVSEWRWGDAAALSAEQHNVIHAVLKNYGRVDAEGLRELDHVRGRPWRNARSRAGFPTGRISTEEIFLDDIHLHFTELLGAQTRIRASFSR